MIYFHFQKGNTDGCLESRGHLFNSNKIDGFFFYSLVLLFCAALLLTVLFLFQKAAINNTLISKESLCDFML